MCAKSKDRKPAGRPGGGDVAQASTSASLHHWVSPGDAPAPMRASTAIDCGWGRVLFGQTFDSHAALLKALREERPDERDVAIYVREPQVLVAGAPQDVFLDPSVTLRRDLEEPVPAIARRDRARIREATPSDLENINSVLRARGMVPLRADFLEAREEDDPVVILLACAGEDDAVEGVVMGIDHGRAFGDPEAGASLWALSVDPQAMTPGIGTLLVDTLSARLREAGCRYLDLSVMHDNEQALALYRQRGFEAVPAYCVKRKNPVNATLYMSPAETADLNPYAEIIVDEARRRGIRVNVEDADYGLFRLTHGGRTVSCRESLSDLTSAVSLSRCDDKALTTRLLSRAGLNVPEQRQVQTADEAVAFRREVDSIVIKPARGEQGHGVFVNLASDVEVREAFDALRADDEVILAEHCVEGDDLRIVVIGDEVVAAAIRRAPEIRGNGKLTAAELIAKQSRRRRAATGGESEIPIDPETDRCLNAAGFAMEDIIPEGRSVTVRQTANLHTGGTLHDVTDDLHPELRRVALAAARALEIPVVGLDLIVPAADSAEYAIIEANERPGLANHEPQPTAERFVDLLFPETVNHNAP